MNVISLDHFPLQSSPVSVQHVCDGTVDRNPTLHNELPNNQTERCPKRLNARSVYHWCTSPSGPDPLFHKRGESRRWPLPCKGHRSCALSQCLELTPFLFIGAIKFDDLFGAEKTTGTLSLAPTFLWLCAILCIYGTTTGRSGLFFGGAPSVHFTFFGRLHITTLSV